MMDGDTKALHKAHEAMEDGDCDKWGKMIDIYRDIDHVCRSIV